MSKAPETLSRKDFADYEFIIEELRRFAKMGDREQLKHLSEHRKDAFSMLRLANGNSIVLGHAAGVRFHQIVDRGIESLGPVGRKHDRSNILSALKREFVRTLESGASTITEENAHELFQSAIFSLKAQHRDLTHYIPCSAVSEHHPDRFSIGPVNFILREKFVEENKAKLLQRPHPVLGDEGFSGFKNLFSEFNWVACVKVPACDSSVSKQRAQEAIQTALNVLKLFIGGRRTQRVRHAYDVSTPSRTLAIVSPSPGVFDFSYSGRFRDAVVPDGWYDTLSKNKYWQIANSVISAQWDYEEVPEPVQRFYDGLAWHGDAISETHFGAKIVKFWTAIERVVSLKDGDPVTRRAAALSLTAPLEFPKRFIECQRLYSNRSSVIHGVKAYITDKAHLAALESEDVSQMVLFSYLEIINILRSNRVLTRKGLEQEFQRIDLWSKK